jgi:putative hydrolase of the HAD superfamily
VLARLARSGRRLAVVSNAEGQVEQDLIAAGLGQYLETVVDSHRVGVSKPDPRIFAICLARLGAIADQCVYVGDVPAFDVVGAQAAGIAPILLDPHGLHDALHDVVRIRSLAELPGLLGVPD